MFKIYVGNLDLRCTAEMLKPYFEPFGDLDEIIIAQDSKTGKSRGFAIVLFRDPLKGQLAIETLTGKKIGGRAIVINEALKKGKGKPAAPTDKPVRQGPFGPRFQAGAGRGGPGAAGAGGPARRMSSRNPRRSGGFSRPGPGGPAGLGGAGGPGGPAGGAGPGTGGPGQRPGGFGGGSFSPRPGGPSAPRPPQRTDDDE